MNNAAVDQALEALNEIKVPASWANAGREEYADENVPEFVKNVMRPMIAQHGDKLPVSALPRGRNFPDSDNPVRKTRSCNKYSGMDTGKLHTVQPVLFCMSSCCHKACSCY